ncbi:nitronate monooxygenase, partial [Bacillus sp. MHSD17]|nr:nitronate monooxygenase [Bacillus sp. MHSD17]
LKDFIGGAANKRFIYDGKNDQGFGWAGQVTGMIHDIPTVQELMNRMVAEAESIRVKWGQ